MRWLEAAVPSQTLGQVSAQRSRARGLAEPFCRQSQPGCPAKPSQPLLAEPAAVACCWSRRRLVAASATDCCHLAATAHSTVAASKTVQPWAHAKRIEGRVWPRDQSSRTRPPTSLDRPPPTAYNPDAPPRSSPDDTLSTPSPAPSPAPGCPSTPRPRPSDAGPPDRRRPVGLPAIRDACRQGPP